MDPTGEYQMPNDPLEQEIEMMLESYFESDEEEYDKLIPDD